MEGVQVGGVDFENQILGALKLLDVLGPESPDVMRVHFGGLYRIPRLPMLLLVVPLEVADVDEAEWGGGCGGLGGADLADHRIQVATQVLYQRVQAVELGAAAGTLRIAVFHVFLALFAVVPEGTDHHELAGGGGGWARGLLGKSTNLQ